MKVNMNGETVKSLLLRFSEVQSKRLGRNKFYCSGLPMCPVKWIWTEKVPPIESDSFSTDFYTNIGTIVHTVVQNWLGYHGVLWGNWKCPSCGDSREYTTVEGYCACGAMWEYQELYVRCPETGLSGYIDGILLLKDGTIVIVDFKTSKKHQQEYVHQIMSYWYMLQNFGPYDKSKGVYEPDPIFSKISEGLLFYIQRGNPWSQDGIFYHDYDKLDSSYYHKNIYNWKIAQATLEHHREIDYKRVAKNRLSKDLCTYCEYNKPEFGCHKPDLAERLRKQKTSRPF